MDQAIIPLDAETKVAERPHDHKDELRLWLRLFACKELIESEVRRRLRESFSLTLPRFDLMAQLDRAPKGMTLGELSQRMMVSNGNVTGLVDRLVEQGLIDRRPSPKDRRAQIVTLTAEGRRFFRAIARRTASGSGRCLPTFRRPTSKASCVSWPKPRCLRAGRSHDLESRNSEMDLAETLSWPFFDDGHRRFAAALTAWADA